MAILHTSINGDDFVVLLMSALREELVLLFQLDKCLFQIRDEREWRGSVALLLPGFFTIQYYPNDGSFTLFDNYLYGTGGSKMPRAYHFNSYDTSFPESLYKTLKDLQRQRGEDSRIVELVEDE